MPRGAGLACGERVSEGIEMRRDAAADIGGGPSCSGYSGRQGLDTCVRCLFKFFYFVWFAWMGWVGPRSSDRCAGSRCAGAIGRIPMLRPPPPPLRPDRLESRSYPGGQALTVACFFLLLLRGRRLP